MKTNEILMMDCGNSSILIECVEANIPGENDCTEPSGLQDTIKKLPKELFADLGAMARSVADEFKTGLDTMGNMDKEVELEFSFAITTGGKLLVLSGETELGIKLKMKWKT